MSYKIKFHFLQSLFRFFSYWADKTNGWVIFVKPKLLIGSLMIGVGVSSNVSCIVTCYDPAEPPPEVTCYDMPPPSDTDSLPTCYMPAP